MAAGQPTKYKEVFNEQVLKLCALGAKDTEVADFFKGCEATINNWKHDYPEFLESIKKGKDKIDTEMVEGAQLHRALGYEHKEDKVFNANGHPLVVPTTKHYPPDSTALIFWLKNRNPSRWRDKQDIDVTSAGDKIEGIGVVLIKPKEVAPTDG